MSNLDVALRLRLETWKPGQVKSAANDLARLGAAATKLNSTAVQSKLGNDLRAIGVASGKLVSPLNRAKQGSDQLGKSLERVAAAGKTVTVNPKLQAELKGASTNMTALAAAGVKLRPVIANADELARALERVRAAGWRASRATDKIKLRPGTKPPGPSPDPNPSPNPDRKRRKDAERLSGRRVGTEALAYAGGGAALLSQGRNVVAGAAVAGGVLAVGGAMAKATGEAISFEKAMAAVRIKLDGMDDPKQLEAMEKVINRAAVSYGRSRGEVASLVAEGGASGISAKEMPDFIRLALAAGVAWDVSGDKAANALAKVKASTQWSIDQLREFGDKVNALSDAGAAKEMDVVDMFQRAGASAKAANVDFDTSLAFMTAFNNIGTAPDVAARGFQSMAAKLRNATDQGGKMDEGLKMLGLTSKQVEAGMKKDAAKTLIDLFERLEKSTDKAKAAIKMFGQEWWDEAAKAGQALPEIRKNQSIVSEKTKTTGSMDKTLNINLSITSNHLERISALASDIGDRLGRWTLPPIKDGLTAIIDLFKQMDERADAMERLQAAAKKVAAGTPLTPEEASAIPDTPEGKKAIAAAVDAQKRGAQADDASITGTKIDQSNGEQALQQHAQLMRRNLQREADALEKRLSLIDPDKKRNLDQARLTGMRRQLAMYQDAPPGRAQLGPARFGLTGANKTGDNELPRKGTVSNVPPAWATGGGQSLWQPRPFSLGGPGGAGRPVDDASIAKVQKLAAEIQKLQSLNIHLVSDTAKADNIRQIEDLKNKLTATLTAADLSPAAKEMMQKYTSALGEQGEEAKKKAQAIIDQIKALLNVTLTPTIAPRLTMPSMGGATPASTGGGTPAKKSAARSSGQSPIQIGQAHFHGVNDVAGMQRQLAAAANRRARDSADNSLKDMDTGAA